MLRAPAGVAAGFQTLALGSGAASGLDAAQAGRASRALCTVEGGGARVRIDGGDATGTSGHKLADGDSILLEHADQIAKASFHRSGPTPCTLHVTFLR